jgi:hypothetical protein
MKENVFFNTRFTQASFFESAGSFFLTPIHYLFNGKSITQVDSNRLYQIQQTFDYGKDSFPTEMLKTILAIVSLPVSLLLGGALKGLSFLSPDVRDRHASIIKEIESSRVENHEQTYRQQGINALFSNQKLDHQNYPFPAPTEKQLAQMKAVEDVAHLLEKSAVPYWLDCGTLLGARRHGSMIPWDFDVDMGILSNDHTNVMRVLRQLDPKKYQVQDWSSSLCPKMFIRVLIKEIDSYLDIYHHEISPQDQTISYKCSWEQSPWVPDAIKRRELVQQRPIKIDDVFPLKTAKFGNATVRVPYNWESFLQVKYGKNLNPCKIWDPSTEKYEKVIDHPYWQHSDF